MPQFPALPPQVLAALAGFLIALAGGGPIAAFYYRQWRRPLRNREQRQKATTLIEEDNPIGALAVIREEKQYSRDEAGSGAWLCLEADALAQQGKRAEARKMLASKSLTDDQEGGRLARLAALQVDIAPDESWANMLRALAAAPNDPAVYLQGGRVLEQIGEVPKAAKLVEHAVTLAPQDPFVRSQAGDFFRREGNLMRALQIWSEGLNPPSTGSLWLKTLFWHKVALPVPVKFEGKTRPEGPLRPVIDLLLTLSPHRFWDEQAFAPIAKRAPDLAHHQEIYWLRLLECIRAGHDERALALLNRARFGGRAWHPHLEMALFQMLTYRINGSPDREAATDFVFPYGLAHPFFASIEQWARSGTCDRAFLNLIQSEDAAAAAFLAAGWDEAGLRLLKIAIVASQFPPWYMRDMHAAWDRNGSRALAAQFGKQRVGQAVRA